ncbi:hypothetical protein BO94DRAFT_532259 [Aspergillus sclerotioniger CBS 115572]|uniref:Uncharacterized protein n=1 Tax=Aspergillus sclerotioniger CBS 115572 TaxID=1450535 RepID=A0A317X7X4_9EURO|nr:hypothetical protein BO94DRAFT_532259 [Aspergillus sclerotioniger CBS 115572]PWY94311.1 hypothetical protein BO94DRAFT_532259 [Aspergillus sclerotioniger CBS 115572]
MQLQNREETSSDESSVITSMMPVILYCFLQGCQAMLTPSPMRLGLFRGNPSY